MKYIHTYSYNMSNMSNANLTNKKWCVKEDKIMLKQAKKQGKKHEQILYLYMRIFR